jgi:trimethylamine:corrinoid methyltransferase-like protein
LPSTRNFKELWFPKLLDRDYYQAWKDGGAVGSEERCRQRKEEIRSTHQVPPVPPELNREFERIPFSARRELLN